MRKLLPLVAVFALLLPACSGGSQQIARVGDHIITMDDISALYDTATVPNGEPFREVLFRLMATDALSDAYVAEFGEPVDETAVDTLFSSFMDQVTQAGMTVAEALGTDGASDEMLRFNAYITVLRDGVVEHLIADPTNLDLIWDEGRPYTQVCVRHILTATPEELDAAVARLQAGEDFATVADEVSLDTNTPGGDLGCALAIGYVTQFADAALTAPIGELTYPVQTDFGYHALIVDSRELVVTHDEFTADPMSYMTQDQATQLWALWFNEKLQNADAEVLDPERYGTWSAVGIVPPEDTTSSTTTTAVPDTSGG